MDHRTEVREFLTSRRARLTPELAGLPNARGDRRVPGLRREEVAMLAGFSTEYYTRFERGNLAGASESVLEALARALQLNEAERSHLFDLARTANASPIRQARKTPLPTVRPHLQRVLDAMVDVPAFVRNGRLDILAINPLGRALYAEAFRSGANPVNLARFSFLDPGSRVLYPDWEKAADKSVALLRTEAGRDPYDKGLTDLVGELCTRSDAFRTKWAAHEVRLHHSGIKQFSHPEVGPLELAFESLSLPAEPGFTLTTYSAEPGSASSDGLRLLATLVSTAAAAADAETTPTPH